MTAAATTAVFATGAGPGVTAFATTAVFATGCPMTPTRPTRAGLSGMFSLLGLQCVVGFDRGDDRLDGNAPVGDQLAAGAARSRREGRGPEVLPDQDAGGAARLHGGGEVRDVVLGQQLRQLGLDLLQRAELLDVGELHRVDAAVLVLGEDQDVDHADGAGIDQRQQLVGHLAREVAVPGRELDDHVVDRAELVESNICHFQSSLFTDLIECRLDDSMWWPAPAVSCFRPSPG